MKNPNQIPVLIAVLLAMTLMALPGCKKGLFDFKPEPTPEEIRNAAQNALRDSIIGKTWRPFARVGYNPDGSPYRLDTIRNCSAYSELVFLADSFRYHDPLNNDRCNAGELAFPNLHIIPYNDYPINFRNSSKDLEFGFGRNLYIRKKGLGYIEIYGEQSCNGIFDPQYCKQGYIFKQKN